MKIALLTSSRADYGIYLSLIKELKRDSFFHLHIIAFGTHLSVKYGKSVKQIINDGFEIDYEVDTMPDGDSPFAIASAIGKTVINFTKIWKKEKYDLVLALGDRYEMFAACSSVIPFTIPIAHIHGGETTLGAIDDAFRNAITQMAVFHFTTTEEYKKRVVAMKGSELRIFNVGALSIDNLKALKLFSIEEIKENFGIDMSIPSILITFHPETVAFTKNKEYIHELIEALDQISGFQYVITMPNADTMGNVIRKELLKFVERNSNVVLKESIGTIGYLSCMKYCSMMLGNTSSGFVEAAYFPKYVINLGDRQRGRILTSNIYSCAIKKEEIVNAVYRYEQADLSQMYIYGDGTAASKIVSKLKIEFS